MTRSARARFIPRLRPIRTPGFTRRSERGQVLPIVAAVMAVILAFAGLSIDVGRQAAERRYLQNAADAGALAGCEALIDDLTSTAAAQEAYNTALANLGRSPAGATAQLAPVNAPVYEPGRTGDPAGLASGVLVLADGTVRVAIRSNVSTVLARTVGVSQLAAAGRARCTGVGSPDLPIVARRYRNPTGPNRTRGNTPAKRRFVDYLATEGTSTLGQVDTTNVLGYDTRTAASRSAPGPVYQIYGPDAKATNAAWYHGLAIYDIRNFYDENSRVYYNGVPAGANASTQKGTAWTYITRGYPGPGFPPVTSPPDPSDQVAVIAGINAAQVMGAFNSKYRVGDEVLLPVYYGRIEYVADFVISPPPDMDIPATGSGTTGPSFLVSRDQRFRDPVSLTLVGDNGARTTTPARPEYDLVDEPMASSNPARGRMTATFSQNNFVPATAGTRVTIQNIATDRIDAGIYTVWLQGSSGSPLYRLHRYPVTVAVGGAERDFDLANSTLSAETTTAGEIMQLPIYVATGTGPDAYGGTGATPVQLSVDADCAAPPCFPAGQVSFSSNSVMPSSVGSGTLSTMTVNTSGVGPGEYTFTLRATGTNGDRQPVTHLATVTINVQTSVGDNKYVDIIGWAIFKITEIGSNYFNGQAISGVYATSNDPALRTAQRARLIPWS